MSSIVLYDPKARKAFPLTTNNIYRYTILSSIFEKKYYGSILQQATRMLNCNISETNHFTGRLDIFRDIVDFLVKVGIYIEIIKTDPGLIEYNIIYPPPMAHDQNHEYIFPSVRVAVVYVIVGDKVLVHMRAKHKGAYIAPPGGKRERGEIARQTAIRELREESGVVIHEDEIYPIYYDYFEPEQEMRKNLVAFATYPVEYPKVRGPLEAHKDEINMDYKFYEFDSKKIEEGTGHAWVPIKELKTKSRASKKGNPGLYEILNILIPE